MSNTELLSIATELRGLKNMAAELAEQIDALESVLKAEMLNQGIDRLYVGDVKITWTEFDTTRFDTKTFKAEHTELYEQYAKTIKARRFSVS